MEAAGVQPIANVSGWRSIHGGVRRKPVRFLSSGLAASEELRKVIHSIEGYEFVAAADRYRKLRRRTLRGSRAGASFYPDIWEMVEAQKPETITIAVPHHYHAEYTIGCLQRGINVMCEARDRQDQACCRS